MKSFDVTCLFFLSISLLMDVIWCFKLFGVHIPQSVSVGDTVPIHCIFDLQGSSLYSLKWHKNGREFFRLYRAASSSLPLTSPAPPTPPFHQPSQVGGGKGGRRKNQKNKQHHISQQQHQMYQQQTQSTNSIQLFPMPGIDVDEARSQNGSLVLRNVTHASSGRYTCEVSVDQTFETAIESKELRVSASSSVHWSRSVAAVLTFVMMANVLVSGVALGTHSNCLFLLHQ